MLYSSPPQYSSVVAGCSSGAAAVAGKGAELNEYLNPQHPDSSSLYTLATVADASPPRAVSPVSLLIASDRAPLLAESLSSSSYGAANTPHSPAPHRSSRRLLLNAGIKMSVLFIVSTLVLGGTLWIALPTLEQQDRHLLRVPKSFAQLQDLNFLLKKYRDFYPARIVICYVTTYLFLQAFSLPGSMYLSILGGAVWGVPIALPLACACVATGATLCYLISAALGPALLALPRWKARLDGWSTKLAAQRANMFSYLIILRIAPFPPHWVVNVFAPHLGIGLLPFWGSTFLGILGVTVIHTTIGGGLDEMTSAADFHLVSWRNVLGLSAVVVGVLIPVGLRFVLGQRVGDAELGPDDGMEEGDYVEVTVGGDTVLAQGPRALGKAKAQQLLLLEDSDSECDECSSLEDEEDEILERGPAIDYSAKLKGKTAATDYAENRRNDWRELPEEVVLS